MKAIRYDSHHCLTQTGRFRTFSHWFLFVQTGLVCRSHFQISVFRAGNQPSIALWYQTRCFHSTKYQKLSSTKGWKCICAQLLLFYHFNLFKTLFANFRLNLDFRHSSSTAYVWPILTFEGQRFGLWLELALAFYVQ